MPVLILFYRPSCPYCQKVIHFLGQNKINIPLKNTFANPGNRDELVKIGGRIQVPCLVIDGKALYESEEIIKWFKQNWKNQ